jgi:FtsP/CotA-like multicopper oxidase with cupredoxin domain
VNRGQGPDKRKERITPADRLKAAERAADAGFVLEAVGMADMAMPDAAPRYFSHPNYANSPEPGNIVAEWNAIAQELVQPTPMPGMPSMSSVSMSAAFVYLAYTQAAVYNTLVAIEGGYTPYNSTLPVSPNASREAAVASAAYGVLKHYFPDDPSLDGKYAASLAALPESIAKTEGIALGLAAATEIINLRAGDVLSGDDGYVVPAPGPGVWEPTMPMPPMDPWMRSLTPFLRATPDEYRVGPPPALDDPDYLADFAEVRDVGGAMSLVRTPEQTEVAQFWTTNMVIQTNDSYRNVAETRSLNLIDTARLMALGNMAAADSLIATFDTKYFYNFWRPVTAIRHTNPDGSYSPTEVNTWMPVVATPNFPEYVAGHGSFMSAQAEVYADVLGTTQIEIDLDSSVTGTTRHYATVDDIRTEIIDARTWGGMHFRTSSELAVALGQQLIADGLLTHFLPAPSTGEHATISGGMRKFVDGLPGLTEANANNLGQYIPVAIPDTTTYPGADYYEIAVVQYREQMHSDLPPTLLRGYVQISTAVVPGEQVQLTNALLNGTEVEIPGFFGVTSPHYLGTTIVAEKDRPVRVKFFNLLPTGIDGDLFIPVDTTVMGSGMGPLADMEGMMDDPQNPMCSMGYDMDGNRIAKDPTCYAENRATLHLHGGISPWISDGTPHQWITPAGENTLYPEGVSVVPVPDMDDSGAPDDGIMTFYYTNQQSARLMFYHDHSYGITRLNVYAGEAAPYILTDPTEQALLDQALIPADQIPLVIQDKTFVPGESQLALQDETWDVARWGGPGNLWVPHVYSPAQNPEDIEGVNAFGRWMYGPWFWPPTNSIDYGPVPNPYYDQACIDRDDPNEWCEPYWMPGTPYNSMGMEAFNDTPVVNGTAYPTLTIDPKSYRFRILNAANDRFFNLSWYVAVDAEGNPCDPSNLAPVSENTGVACTEVLLNPAEVLAALDDPATVFPTPVAGFEGPDWIQIGTEGGFLPAPAVLPAQPTTWVNDPTLFNAGNVDQHSLLVAPAERADVIVDFSQYAGYTLILYNDAPAAFPARDPRYDYYTGSADLRDTGGVKPILPGYGPNTRTVMQVKVNDLAPEPAFDLGALQTAFRSVSLGGGGVFESGQNPIIVGQAAYNSAYGTSFRSTFPRNGFARIQDFSITFDTLAAGTFTDFPLQPKQIQDEMGEAFEHEYGRMSGYFGVETPFSQAGLQNMILYSFMNPPTEVLKGTVVGGTDTSLDVTPIASADDGTQIWKITHNGVDTHPVHFHLYEVQLLNRVGWDGIIRKPEANELGWKDTVRVSPLEDTIVALRPVLPHVPWDLPNSIRLLDPTMPEGAVIANSTLQDILGLPIFAFDPNGEPIDIFNHYVNYGWEYVWHCHILSHEEMDMMRPQVVGVTPNTPTNLTAVRVGSGTNRRVDLAWQDTSLNETAFIIQRATSPAGPWADLVTLDSSGNSTGTATYSDPIGNTNQAFYYRVQAVNIVGDTWDYTDPAINEGAGFPTLTLASDYSNIGSFAFPPAAPSNLTATNLLVGQRVRVRLDWVDNAANETGFTIERALNSDFTLGLVSTNVAANSTSSSTGNLSRTTTYYFRIRAYNQFGVSAWSNTVSITTP